MNDDCLLMIAQFAGPKQSMQLSREFTGKFCPQSILICGYKQLLEFYEWSRNFDMSNLKEVRIVIQETKLMESLHTHIPNAARAVGLVPSSVKKLTLCVYNDAPIEITDGVEEVVIEMGHHLRGLQFPDSVRSIHIVDGFQGLVYRWPSNLERLCINGWCTGNGRWPVPIENIPDTVRYMILGSHLDIEIQHWPESLETLVFEGNPDDFGWSIEDAGIPEWVNVSVNETFWNGVWDESMYDDAPDTIWDL